MTLATLAQPSFEYFNAGPAGITLPTDLTIKFRARFVSRVASANDYSALSVYFSFGGGLGSRLNLGSDDVWLVNGDQVRGAATSVDTDDTFHTYRIEVIGASLGSAIKVYYDNALRPLLTGAVVSDATLNRSDPEVGFGDRDEKDSGVSEWEYLWHNASRIPVNAIPEPTTAALLTAAVLLLGRRKPRRN